MAMSNAERQRRYRERSRSGNHQLTRISMMLSAETKEQLERLALFYKVPQRRVLETLVRNAEKVTATTNPEEYERATRTITQ